MAQRFTHPEIAKFAEQLMPLIENPPERPNTLDYDAVSIPRKGLLALNQNPSVPFDQNDREDWLYLMRMANWLLNLFSAFADQNNRLAPVPRERLLAVGESARITDVLATFLPEGSADTVRRDIFRICLVLNIKTIGELAKRPREEIVGRDSWICGAETLDWIELVCNEFSLQRPSPWPEILVFTPNDRP